MTVIMREIRIRATYLNEKRKRERRSKARREGVAAAVP